MATGKFAPEKRYRLSRKIKRQQQEKRWYSSSKKSIRWQKKPGTKPAVQTLFEMCKEIFSDCGPGVVPSAEDVERLRSLLDKMDALDVGLSEDMPYFSHVVHQGNPKITYLHLYECDKFSICIFCLPPSSVIPLHNHPGMTVFSKLLFGSMHVKSYDWADAHHPSEEFSGLSDSVQSPGVRLAKVKVDSTLTAPCKTTVLYPEDGGNMHCFTAKTACAVLDVLGPPYSSDEEGRDCTYYNDFPCDIFPVSGGSCSASGRAASDGAYALLEEREQLDGFVVVGAKYMGPKILER